MALKLGIGLIGCGGIGLLRARAAGGSPFAELVACADTDEGRARAAAEGTRARVTTAWRELLSDSRVDAVVVSTPPHLHAEMTIAALEAGKHVLCEKPLARTAAEARAMLEAASRAGRTLATGYNFRFYSPLKMARELLDRGVIGELDHVRAYAGYSAAGHDHPWLRDPAIVGGGAMRDIGTHIVDSAMYFLGAGERPIELHGFSTARPWGFPGCEDNGFVLVREPGGRVAQIQGSWTEYGRYQFRLDLVGTAGQITLTCFPMTVSWCGGGRTPGGSGREKLLRDNLMIKLKSYRWVVTKSFVEEYEEFAKLVSGKPSLMATGFDGVRALEIAESTSRPEALGWTPAMSVRRPMAISREHAAPDLSVVLVTFGGRETLPGCLDAIARMTLNGTAEVIVPADAKIGGAAEWSARYPSVRFVEVAGDRTYAELRSIGVRAARGRVVAITEGQVSPSVGWAEELMAAHGRGEEIVGGTIEKQAGSALAWAFYLMDYIRYAKPKPAGATHALTDCNVSYRRELLERIAPVWEHEFHEPNVHEALVKLGKRLWLEPDAMVNHTREWRVGAALWDRYAFGRLFAATRPDAQAMARRVMLAGLSAVVPFLITLRSMLDAKRTGRYVKKALMTSPLLFLVAGTWAFGELVGYVTRRPSRRLRARASVGRESVVGSAGAGASA